MKKNNRGFLLAESLVVSTFVLTVLILLYVQFSNLTINYKNSYNYNNVESIYDLSSVVNYLKVNNYNLSEQLTEDKPYVVVYKDESCNMSAGLIDVFCDRLINKMGAKTIIYTSSDISIIQNYVSNNEDNTINQHFRDFISRVETNVVQNKGRLFAEFNNGTYATIAMDNVNTEVIITSEDLKELVVTEGDGLYIDEYEEGKYTYKGANPNNYITFNNENWRILSIDQNGSIKIIRNELLPNRVFDSTNSNLWDRPSDIKTYLNGDYLTSIQETTPNDYAKIVQKTWSIGAVTNINNNLAEQIENENNSQSESASVGLITASEYLRANTNNELCGNFNLNNNNLSIENNDSTCKTTNWLIKNNDYWIISPYTGSDNLGYTILPDGQIYSASINNSYYIAPVLYLKSDTKLTGEGTIENPYQIK